MGSLNHRSGQSLLEVLIATAIGAILIIGAATIISPALRENKDAAKIQAATAISRQLVDGVRAWAEGDWHNVSALSTGSSARFYLAPGSSSSTPYRVASGTESILAVPSAGLVAHWKMDENRASSALDFSGSNLHATGYNDISTSTGYAGGGFYFGGTTAQLIPSSTQSLKYQGGDMTISFWARPTSSDDGGYLISKPWNGSGQYNYSIRSSGGATPDLTFVMNGATGFSNGFGRSLKAGTWQHVAVSVASSTKAVRFYIDGQLSVATTHGIVSWAPTLGDANANNVMGCIYPYASNSCAGATTYAYKGELDDVRIYNRVLSDAELGGVFYAESFWRNFYLDTVYRDSNGAISGSGTLDPSTLKLSVVAGWGTVSSTLSSFLTRFSNRRFMQTNWAGGPGQDGPVTSTNSRFSTSSGISYDSSTATSSGFFYVQGMSF